MSVGTWGKARSFLKGRFALRIVRLPEEGPTRWLTGGVKRDHKSCWKGRKSTKLGEVPGANRGKTIDEHLPWPNQKTPKKEINEGIKFVCEAPRRGFKEISPLMWMARNSESGRWDGGNEIHYPCKTTIP